MRKVLHAAVLIMIFIMAGCDLNNDTSVVRLKISNITTAGNESENTLFNRIFSLFVNRAYAQSIPETVDMVNFAILGDGSTLAIRSIPVAEISADNVIEFSVPSGKNRTVLVVAQQNFLTGAPDLPVYFGAVQRDLSPGTIDITVTMQDSVWSANGPQFFQGEDIGDGQVHLFWDGPSVDGINYIVEHEVESENGYVPYYEGNDTSCTGLNINGGSVASFRLTVDFVPFGLSTSADASVFIE